MTTSSERVTALSFHAGVCALLLLGAMAAGAQNVTLMGATTKLPTSGLSVPLGMAVDGAGDVFLADEGNNRVVEVPYLGSAGYGPQTTVPTSGLLDPTGVAVDGAGNVFIADRPNNRVVEVPYMGGGTYGPQITLPASGLNSPFGVAVSTGSVQGDVYEQVYIADSGNNRVMFLQYLNGTYNGQFTLPVSGLSEPTGLALDGAGALYIVDTGNSRVLADTQASGWITLPASVIQPYAVAVDGAGSVFIADSFNNRVVEVPYVGKGNYGAQIPLVTGLRSPYGVAVDQAGNVFLSDSLNNQVLELPYVQAVNFGNIDVCPAAQTTPTPCNQTVPLNYNVNSPTTFGPPAVDTQGAPNLDFTLSNGGTCTGTVSGGSTCTVNVTFAPIAPGLRQGSVQIFDNTGNLLATTPVHGVGQGPAIAFGPSIQTTVPANGLNTPLAVAVDAAGNVFIADNSGGAQVVKVPYLGNGSYGPQVAVLFSGLGLLTGVTVDGAGDLFVLDGESSLVAEVPYLDKGNYGAQAVVLGKVLNGASGVALDGAGDLFIADTFNNRVVEIPYLGPYLGNYYGVLTTVGSGLNRPFGVALDGAGDLFIADTNNSRVVEVPYLGKGVYGAQTEVPTSGLKGPTGVAVDAAGDVFTADTPNNVVVEVPYLSPGGFGAQTTVVSGVTSPESLAVDAAGDLFVADTNNNRVVELNRSQPPSLSFASTPVGQTSTDSPQSLTMQNIGNQRLDAVAPGLSVPGPNFVQVAGTGTFADCGIGFSLAPLTPGETCNLSISFEPQSLGSLAGTAVLTDNALNASPSASQSISLQGAGGKQSTTTIVGSSLNPSLYGQAVSFSASVASARGTPTGTVQFQIDGLNFGSPVTLSGGTSSSGSVSNLTAGSHTVAATYSGDASYSVSSGTLNAGQTVNQNTTTTAVTGCTPNPSTYGQPLVCTVTVTANSPGGATPTGAITWTNLAGCITSTLSGGAASCTTSLEPAGPNSISAAYGGDSNYEGSSSTGYGQVVKTATTSTALVSSLNPSAFGQSVTFTATIRPSGAGTPTGTVVFFDFTNASTLGTFPLSGNQATIVLSILPVGTAEIAAYYSGDTNFTGSVSHEVLEVVKKAGTTTEVSSSLNPALVGQTITYTATVTSQYLGMVSGTVDFKSGTVALGSVGVVNGQASFTTSYITSGSDRITAKYVGDANNTGSTSPALTQVVNKYPSSTTIGSDLNPSIVGQTVPFTATVTAGATGTVTFKSGGKALGTVSLTGGTASLSTSALAVGSHNIAAVYSGDGTFQSSTSPLLTQVVNKAPK